MFEFTTDEGVLVRLLERPEYVKDLPTNAPTGATMPRAMIRTDDDAVFDEGDVLIVYVGAVDDPDFEGLVGHEITHALGLDHPDYYKEGVWRVFVHALRRGFDLTAATGLLRWRKSPRSAWRIAQAVSALAREIHEGSA